MAVEGDERPNPRRAKGKRGGGEEEEEEAGRNEASSVENRSGNLHACCLLERIFAGIKFTTDKCVERMHTFGQSRERNRA